MRALCHRFLRENGQQRFQHEWVAKSRRKDSDWGERAFVTTRSTSSLEAQSSDGWKDSWDSWEDSWDSWAKKDSWAEKDSWEENLTEESRKWETTPWHEHDWGSAAVNTPTCSDPEDIDAVSTPTCSEPDEISVGGNSDSESYRARMDPDDFQGVREYKGVKLSKSAKNHLISQQFKSALEKGMPTADQLIPQNTREGGCPKWWKDTCLEWYWREHEQFLPPVVQSCTPNVMKVMAILQARLEGRIGDPIHIGEDLYRCPCLGTVTKMQGRILKRQEVRYHGTKWMCVFSIGWTRTFQESCDESLGHTFDSDPGVYVAANRPKQHSMAVGYSRFQMICGDGVLWAPYIEVNVDPHRQRKISESKRKGGQEAYDPEGVVATAIMLLGRRPHQMNPGDVCLLPLNWLASIEINPRLASP